MSSTPPDINLQGDEEILYTASDIGRRTAKSKFSVHRAMAGTKPSAKVLKEGNPTHAWRVEELPPELRQKLHGLGIPALRDLVEKLWKDRWHPTERERAEFFDTAFLWLEDLKRQGLRERTVIAMHVEWISSEVRVLAKNQEALRRNYYRLLAKWRESGRKWTALCGLRDKAAKRRSAPNLPKEDFDLLAIHAVKDHGGSLYPAWRKHWHELSEPTKRRYPLGAKVPNRVAKQLIPEIKRLMPYHIGPRAARLNGCSLEREYDGYLFAGDLYSSDDTTLPVYCYDPAEPAKLFRGQFLPIIDVRSKRILDFAFESANSYTAQTIRTLTIRTFKKFGIPRQGLHWECGIWKEAKLLGGDSRTDPWSEARETFADRLGIRILHALPGNARAKIVERIFGALQNLMEGEPGYVGRDEMNLKYERVQKAKLEVESGRKHPSQAGFYSVAQWIERLHEICSEYNATLQDSKVIGGRMSPDEAWRNLQAQNAEGKTIGLQALPEGVEHLFWHKEVVLAGRQGITLFGGKYRYTSDVTAGYENQSVIAWFNSEDPSFIIVTDLKGNNPQSVPQRKPVPAFGAFEPEHIDETRKAVALVNAHNGYARRRYSELSAGYIPPRRAVLVDPITLEQGRQFEQQRQEQMALKRSTKRRDPDAPLSGSAIGDPSYADFMDDEVPSTMGGLEGFLEGT